METIGRLHALLTVVQLSQTDRLVSNTLKHLELVLQFLMGFLLGVL